MLFLHTLNKRTSSGSQDDDGDDEDEDDTPKFVRNNLTAIKTSNIIPINKRRATALASGLITKNSSVRSSNSIVSTSKIYDSDD